ncbi:hypothetical protein ACWGRF_22970 [Streptomyces zhihengii]
MISEQDVEDAMKTIWTCLQEAEFIDSSAPLNQTLVFKEINIDGVKMDEVDLDELTSRIMIMEGAAPVAPGELTLDMSIRDAAEVMVNDRN